MASIHYYQELFGDFYSLCSRLDLKPRFKKFPSKEIEEKIEEGYEIVLINSNPATIMTDPDVADKTYIEFLVDFAVVQSAWKVLRYR